MEEGKANLKLVEGEILSLVPKTSQVKSRERQFLSILNPVEDNSKLPEETVLEMISLRSVLPDVRTRKIFS